MIRLTLPLACPSNRLYRALPMRAANGHTFARQVMSKEARLRRDHIVAEVWKQLGGRPVPMTGPVAVQVMVTPRDRRTPDCDAMSKHLLDCLAHASVYANDKQVERLTMERAVEARFPGEMVVEIWEIGQ